jgi:peptidoglycan hydrolase CwlO-like protein
VNRRLFLRLEPSRGAGNTFDARTLNSRETVTAEEDTAMVAGQLADLTRAVQDMADQLNALRTRADSQQERADTQQERIDLAARELAEVSERLQAAANALRESV